MGAYSEYSKMFRDGIVAKAKEAHRPYGGEPAYSITRGKAAMKKFFMPPLIADLKSALNDL